MTQRKKYSDDTEMDVYVAIGVLFSHKKRMKEMRIAGVKVITNN